MSNCFKKILWSFWYWLLIKPYKWLLLKLFTIRPQLSVMSLRRFLKHKDGPLLVVVAFNNERLIRMQIERLKKYSVENFQLLITDNSSDEQIAAKIQTICYAEKVSYIRVPRQRLFRLSDSHGIALNWVYYQIIRKTNFDIVGFLDHDIFPVKQFTISAILGHRNMYGVKHYAVHENNKDVWDSTTPDLWYLWPGFTFFRLKYIRKMKVDFMPMFLGNVYFDTGGSNWKHIYSNTGADDAGFASWDQVKIGDGQVRQYDYVELIDASWVHMINGSFWKNNEDYSDILNGKMRFIIHREKSDSF